MINITSEEWPPKISEISLDTAKLGEIIRDDGYGRKLRNLGLLCGRLFLDLNPPSLLEDALLAELEAADSHTISL
jgi:hypothetical protein